MIKVYVYILKGGINNHFIEYCNENNGFISAVLTIASFLLSILAIVISIIVPKMPYKTKLILSFYTNLGVGLNSGKNFYSVEATNIGNRVVKLSFFGLGYKENKSWKKLYSISTGNGQNILLNINDTTDSCVDYGVGALNLDENTIKIAKLTYKYRYLAYVID